MSSTPPDYALDVLRKRLEADWDRNQTHGYGPGLHHTDDYFLPIHLGEYDDSLRFPQVVIQSTGSWGMREEGIAGYKADGSGLVTAHRSLADINCYAGVEDDLQSGDPDPDELAMSMAQHVREILHEHQQWLVDPDTGERVAQSLILQTEPQAFIEPSTRGDWRALQQVSYETRHDPP